MTYLNDLSNSYLYFHPTQWLSLYFYNVLTDDLHEVFQIDGYGLPAN